MIGSESLTECTTRVVAAYLGRGVIESKDVPDFMKSVYGVLEGMEGCDFERARERAGEVATGGSSGSAAAVEHAAGDAVSKHAALEEEPSGNASPQEVARVTTPEEDADGGYV